MDVVTKKYHHWKTSPIAAALHSKLTVILHPAQHVTSNWGPSITDILPVEKYVTGYACKGNEGTGALADLFKDMASSAENDATLSSLCTSLLMKSVKRDVSSIEACHELSMLPLYRCSHQFQSVSLSGAV